MLLRLQIGRFLLAFAILFAPPAIAAPAALDAIASDLQFNKLARTIALGRYASFPQVMFVLDRGAAGGPVLHFVNTRRYRFHINYIRQQYLSVQSEDELLATSYSRPDRRFILGSILRYPSVGRYGVEFWEGDVLDRTLLTTAMTSLQKAFFRPLAFKPNSQAQIELASGIEDLPVIAGDALYQARESLVLNAGRAVGRLRIVPKISSALALRRDDILIVGEAPLQLAPVAGLVTTQFSTPLAHVNLLAKSWRIPNGYRKDAHLFYAALDGSIVVLEARNDRVSIRAATAAEVEKGTRAATSRAVRIATADLAFRALPALTDQRSADVVRTGAKAANLGEVARRAAREGAAGFSVPAGFSIPFAYYADFIRANGLDVRIDALLADKTMPDDTGRLHAALAALRAAFLVAPIDPALLQSVIARRKALMGDVGVFARSSTNSEDLKGFNGAGLYSSVPNVLGDAALAAAIKTVWASVWNDTAFEARMAAGIEHRGVMASVLIQRGMNADSAGVLITENPFDPTEQGAIFINAKRGLGIRVVEGRRIAEQLLYRADTESIQVLTRSNDDAMLVFDSAGGVRELPAEPGRAVLTDEVALRLARAGRKIAGYFRNKPQDIEWLMIGEQIHIVQSRPYLRGD